VTTEQLERFCGLSLLLDGWRKNPTSKQIPTKVYFKGQWLESFGTELTREAAFKGTQVETVNV
jgi:serine protease inhibitor